jgi:hypothetical protein
MVFAFSVNVDSVSAGQVNFRYQLDCNQVSPCSIANFIGVTMTTNKDVYAPGENIIVTTQITSDDAPQNSCPPTLYLQVQVSAKYATVALPCGDYTTGVPSLRRLLLARVILI